MTEITRAEHVGSLLRPQGLSLSQPRAAGSRKSSRRFASRSETDSLTEQVRAVIQRQIDIGLKSPTDGEWPRHDFFTDYYEQVPGVRDGGEQSFEFTSVLDTEVKHTFTAKGYEATPEVASQGLIWEKWVKLLVSAKDLNPGSQPKITIPSPSLMTMTPESQTQEVKDAVLAFYIEQVEAMAQAGLGYVQFDDPWLISGALLGQEEVNAYHFAQMADLIELMPHEVEIGVHVCRGNYKSGWISAGGYEPVVEKLLSLKADRLLLEFDDERSGDFSVLAPHGDLPDHEKPVIVLGVVSSKRPTVETPDEILARLDEAAKYVDGDFLAVSPQCGFASGEEGNEVSEDVQWAKLENLVKAAERFW